MSHAIVMACSDGRIVHWDDGATELFGHAAAEALGQPVDLIVPEEHCAAHWQGFHRVMGGGERHLVGAATNVPVRMRSGEVLAFPARFVHLDDAAGRPVGALAVFSRRRGDEQPWTPVAPG